jgi:hypothetical protein
MSLNDLDQRIAKLKKELEADKQQLSKDWAEWDADHPYEPVGRKDVTGALRADGHTESSTRGGAGGSLAGRHVESEGYRVQTDKTDGAQIVSHDIRYTSVGGTRSTPEQASGKTDEYESTLRSAGFATERTAPNEVVVHGKYT